MSDALVLADCAWSAEPFFLPPKKACAAALCGVILWPRLGALGTGKSICRFDYI